MRVAVISDLQWTPDHQQALNALVDNVRQAQPDCLILAGNTASAPQQYEAVLKAFAALDCARGAVLGNLELSKTPEHNSQHLWEEVLPSLLNRWGYTSLDQESLQIDGIGICGTIAWYDYSGRDPKMGYSPAQYQELKGLVNEDARSINWAITDQEFAAFAQQRFVARLDKLIADRNVSRIVVVTHFPIFKEALQFIPGDFNFNFKLAYASNLTLGRAIAPKAKLAYVLSGHLPSPQRWEMSFGPNQFNAEIIGSSRPFVERFTVVDL